MPIMTKKFGDPVKDTNSLADNINCCLWNNDLPTLDLIVAALDETALQESTMSNQPIVKRETVKFRTLSDGSLSPDLPNLMCPLVLT